MRTARCSPTSGPAATMVEVTASDRPRPSSSRSRSTTRTRARATADRRRDDAQCRQNSLPSGSCMTAHRSPGCSRNSTSDAPVPATRSTASSSGSSPIGTSRWIRFFATLSSGHLLHVEARRDPLGVAGRGDAGEAEPAVDAADLLLGHDALLEQARRRGRGGPPSRSRGASAHQLASACASCASNVICTLVAMAATYALTPTITNRHGRLTSVGDRLGRMQQMAMDRAPGRDRDRARRSRSRRRPRMRRPAATAARCARHRTRSRTATCATPAARVSRRTCSRSTCTSRSVVRLRARAGRGLGARRRVRTRRQGQQDRRQGPPVHQRGLGASRASTTGSPVIRASGADGRALPGAAAGPRCAPSAFLRDQSARYRPEPARHDAPRSLGRRVPRCARGDRPLVRPRRRCAGRAASAAPCRSTPRATTCRAQIAAGGQRERMFRNAFGDDPADWDAASPIRAAATNRPLGDFLLFTRGRLDRYARATSRSATRSGPRATRRTSSA